MHGRLPLSGVDDDENGHHEHESCIDSHDRFTTAV